MCAGNKKLLTKYNSRLQSTKFRNSLQGLGAYRQPLFTNRTVKRYLKSTVSIYFIQSSYLNCGSQTGNYEGNKLFRNFRIRKCFIEFENTPHISDFVCKITLQVYNLSLEPAVLGKKQEVT